MQWILHELGDNENSEKPLMYSVFLWTYMLGDYCTNQALQSLSFVNNYTLWQISIFSFDFLILMFYFCESRKN